MGKHKLHMVTKKKKKSKYKKSKKSKKKTSKKKSQLDKLTIVDVPLADTISLGSKATKGSVNYHYQRYYNTFAFIKRIIQGDPTLSKVVCIPDIGEGWAKAAIKIHFLRGVKATSKVSVKPVDSKNSKTKFIAKIEACMKHRLVPINLEIMIPGVGAHMNIILIDSKKKTIELFEPHGNRGKDSELESVSQAYFKVAQNVERFFRLYFPRFTFIPPSDYERKEGVQMNLDAYSGLCVTWTILYLHYRILNPDVPRKLLLRYIERRFTRTYMLRYVKFIEDMLKGVR